MRSNIILCMVVLSKIPSGSSSYRPHPAFINHIFSAKTRPFFDTNRVFAAKDNNDAFFDAEEAAAIDAHDVSDPGIEGAAMERAVIMAAEFKEQQIKRNKDDLLEVSDAEANFAHDLSDAAAVEHANEISLEESENEKEDDRNRVTAGAKENDATLYDAEEAAAVDAHDVSDPGIEGAAMERAVIMAAEFKEQQVKREEEHEHESFIGKIKSLFHRDDRSTEEDDEDLFEVSDAEANFAHDLSDAAAVEHANEISLEDSEDGNEDDEDLFEVSDAEAKFAHDLSGAAAVEHANEISLEDGENGNEDDEDLLEVSDAEANFAHDLSDAAAVEHANMVAEYEEESSAGPNRAGEARIASLEKHYNSVEKDIQAIERLIEEADKADRSEGHSLERTFSDDDAADLALMMMEQSILAATDKLEICQKKAEQTENEVRCALEEKYSAKALAESIERERRAAERRFLSAEYDSDDADMSSILRTDIELLSDALKQEHEAELKLEDAIEDDIALKKELEQMIENKAALKQNLHDLEHIVHEHTDLLMKKENAKRSKSDQTKK